LRKVATDLVMPSDQQIAEVQPRPKRAGKFGLFARS
jgi:hypothetical protein